MPAPSINPCDQRGGAIYPFAMPLDRFLSWFFSSWFFSSCPLVLIHFLRSHAIDHLRKRSGTTRVLSYSFCQKPITSSSFLVGFFQPRPFTVAPLFFWSKVTKRTNVPPLLPCLSSLFVSFLPSLLSSDHHYHNHPLSYCLFLSFSFTLT